jgi:hypothetical protein
MTEQESTPPSPTIIEVDSDTEPLTPYAEALYEHMRRCPDCIDAVMEWSRPIFYASAEPGGRVQKNLDAFVAKVRLNHEVVDSQARMFVVHLQVTGQLSDFLDHTAKLEHERRDALKGLTE